MAEEDERQRGAAPGHEGEEPLPGPSVFPIGFAVGAAVLLVGLVLNWVVFGIGGAIAIVFGSLWAADVFRKRRVFPAEPEPAAEEPEVGPEAPERYGRNAFLERATLGLGALIGGVVTVPVVGFAVAPTFIGQRDDDIDLGPLENYAEGEFVVASFRSKRAEGDVSRQTAFIRNNGFANGVPSFTIISNRCVHLGCPTQPGGPTDVENPTEIETEAGPVTLIAAQPASFLCPCHGGAYDTEGNRTAGPPVRALDRYRYSIVDGRLVLGERYSVGTVAGTGANARINAYTRVDPGQHVDGPTDWLYPVSPRGTR